MVVYDTVINPDDEKNPIVANYLIDVYKYTNCNHFCGFCTLKAIGLINIQ